MTQKGVYQYEYMDNFERSQEPQLPSKDSFYSSVTEKDILKTNLQTYAANTIVWILPIITFALICSGKLLLQ